MTVTPSFSFSPRGRNRLATNVFEPDFPLSERKTKQQIEKLGTLLQGDEEGKENEVYHEFHVGRKRNISRKNDID